MQSEHKFYINQEVFWFQKDKSYRIYKGYIDGINFEKIKFSNSISINYCLDNDSESQIVMPESLLYESEKSVQEHLNKLNKILKEQS